MHGLDATLGLQTADFSVSQFHPSDWDYIALGDYHVRKLVYENAAYSGSTDFTSSNPWEEVPTAKGWIWIDDNARIEFQDCQPNRQVLDLPVIDCDGLDGKQIAERLLSTLTWNAEEQPIVRQKLKQVDRTARHEISHQAIRELKQAALHYRLDIEMTAEQPGHTPTQGGVGCIEEWREFVKCRDLPAGIDRVELAETGAKLIDEAGDVADETPA
jgi:hypothetical protein